MVLHRPVEPAPHLGKFDANLLNPRLSLTRFHDVLSAEASIQLHIELHIERVSFHRPPPPPESAASHTPASTSHCLDRARWHHRPRCPHGRQSNPPTSTSGFLVAMLRPSSGKKANFMKAAPSGALSLFRRSFPALPKPILRAESAIKNFVERSPKNDRPAHMPSATQPAKRTWL
jgi:hypothetical protein